MGLETYRDKRNFERTPEPAGKKADGRRAAATFVVQKHAASHLHYDFRLELDGVLKSWAVPKGPSLDPSERRLAVHVEDHPLDYGDFEGVIPQGQYGGGTVLLWDRGTWLAEGDAKKAYAKGRLSFRLEGEKLRGGWKLVRMAPREGQKENWLLIKEEDAEARPLAEGDLLEERPESVATGRGLEEIAGERDRVWHSDRSGGGAGGAPAGGDGALGDAGALAEEASDLPGARRGSLPRTPKAQLATLVPDAPPGRDWLHEIKFDGYRILARIERGRVRLLSRSGKDWTERFPGVAGALGALPCRSTLIDGEVVAFTEDGVSDFQRLQNASASGEDLYYVAFDLLHLDGWDVARSPLTARKGLLERLLADGPAALRYSDHVVGSGPEFHANACKLQLEGIISKRADRPYVGGRGKDWLKAKCLRRQEFVVVGWSEPKGSRTALGALLLGVHDDEGRLVAAGKVGTGFTEASLRQLLRRLEPLEREGSPLADPPRGAAARGVHWVEPELVAEVAFTEWTADGSVRHPSFQGLREDKPAAEVVREVPAPSLEGNGGPAPRPRTTARSASGDAVEVAGVRLSSPSKVIYAGQDVTKLELAEYYVAVAEWALPHLERRPLTLVRCPSGAQEECFFQKKAGDTAEGLVPRVDIGGEGKAEETYLMIDGLASVLALVQLGVLEFHVWGSRADRLERPDRLIFDLDPGEGVAWADVARAAVEVRDFLAELGLTSFLKTTGGTGLHVVVPLVRRSGWDEVKGFAKAVADAFAGADPSRFVSTVSVAKRKGRIYLDYLRNGWNATAVGAYSTRARPGAPVSTPIAWDELDPRRRPEHGVRSLPERLAKLGADPWADMASVRQSLTVAVKEAVGLR
ncbi:MAG TPA: DNA ligase D [Longimicrobiales bacterium]|nr:DNA ligase D [Longimicrobiales bacterium]